MITEERLSRGDEKKDEPYLKVESLVTHFFTRRGIVKAIDKVSFQVYPGEIYGLIGESGCGKTVTCESILDLMDGTTGWVIQGSVEINGYDLLSDLKNLASVKIISDTDVRIKKNRKAINIHEKTMNGIRGTMATMTFQESMMDLNPSMNIGDQIITTVMEKRADEILKTLINRYDMNEKDIRSFIEKLKKSQSSSESNRLKRKFIRDYALSEYHEIIMNHFENSDDITTINSILELARKKSENLDIKGLEYYRGKFSKMKKINFIKFNIINSKRNEDKYSIKKFRNELKNLKRSKGYGTLSESLRYSFSKGKIMKEVMNEIIFQTIFLLNQMNVPGPELVLRQYPDELSNGVKQRVVIAMAIEINPGMLIADEPTALLDVYNQSQIIEVLKEYNQNTGSPIIFVTHDLSIVSTLCQRIGIMYSGNIVEESTIEEIFNDPKHPYTVGLISTIPRADEKKDRNEKLPTIVGAVPNLVSPPSGCRFHPRCKFAMDICSLKKPKMVEISKGHRVACFLYSDESEV